MQRTDNELDAAPGASLSAFRQRTAIVTTLSFLTLVPAVWGEWWALGGLVALVVLRVAVSIRFRVFWLRGTLASDLGGAAFQASLTVWQSHLAHWSLGAWLMLPLSALLADGFRPTGSLRRAATALVLTVPAALLDGQPVGTVAVFALYTALFFVVVEGRGRSLLQAHTTLSASHTALRRAHDELRHMQDHLVRQEKLAGLGVLAGGLAHEINNPMSYVTANVSMLARELRAAATDPELLAEIETDVLPATLEGVQRVNTIVSDLRRFARNDAERPVEVDVNRVITAALRLAKSALEPRCRSQLELGEVPMILGWPQQLSQVLVALFVNAGQAMRAPGGLLTVKSFAEGDHVVVTVTDTGDGMTAETLRQLFTPFFTTRAAGEGRGLGLAIAHELAAAHGGELSASSEPGAGSTFRLRLPVHGPALPAAPAQDKALVHD